MNIKEETKYFYNQIAEYSFKTWFNNKTLLPVLKQFIKKLPEKPKVLDLGCGVGGESKRLVGLGATVIGIDNSEKSIEIAKENIPEAEFYLMDILKMKFHPNSFNGVLDAAVLFHFTENEQIETLKKYSRMRFKYLQLTIIINTWYINNIQGEDGTGVSAGLQNQ